MVSGNGVAPAPFPPEDEEPQTPIETIVLESASFESRHAESVADVESNESTKEPGSKLLRCSTTSSGKDLTMLLTTSGNQKRTHWVNIWDVSFGDRKSSGFHQSLFTKLRNELQVIPPYIPCLTWK